MTRTAIFREIVELELQIGRATPITQRQKQLRLRADVLRRELRRLEYFLSEDEVETA